MFVIAIVIVLLLSIALAAVSENPTKNILTILLFFTIGYFVLRAGYSIWHYVPATVFFTSVALMSLHVIRGGASLLSRRARVFWLLPFISLVASLVGDSNHYFLLSLLARPLYGDAWLTLYFVSFLACSLWYFTRNIAMFRMYIERLLSFLSSVAYERNTIHKREGLIFLAALIVFNIVSFFILMYAVRNMEAEQQGMIVIFMPMYVFMTYGVVMTLTITLVILQKILNFFRKSILSARQSFMSTFLFSWVVLSTLVLSEVVIFDDDWLSVVVEVSTVAAPLILIPLLFSSFITHRHAIKTHTPISWPLTKTTIYALVFFMITLAPVFGTLRFLSEHAIVCRAGLTTEAREACISGKQLRAGKTFERNDIDPEYQQLLRVSASGSLNECDQFSEYVFNSQYTNGEVFCYAAHVVSGRAESDACHLLPETLADECASVVKEFRDDMSGKDVWSYTYDSTFERIVSYIALEDSPRINMIFMNALFK